VSSATPPRRGRPRPREVSRAQSLAAPFAQETHPNTHADRYLAPPSPLTLQSLSSSSVSRLSPERPTPSPSLTTLPRPSTPFLTRPPSKRRRARSRALCVCVRVGVGGTLGQDVYSRVSCPLFDLSERDENTCRRASRMGLWWYQLDELEFLWSQVSMV